MSATEQFDRILQEKVTWYLNRWVELVVEEASMTVPVRTGYLRSTIYGVVYAWVAKVGAKAAYALFVERGTRRMIARPFLESAVRMYLPRLETMIVEAIERAKAEAGFK